MNAVKTIDVKGLGHAEKEGLILPGVEALKINEMARIVVEFNPMPLVYMLKAQGEFEIASEKEGSDEWILQVTRIALKKINRNYINFLIILKIMTSRSLRQRSLS